MVDFGFSSINFLLFPAFGCSAIFDFWVAVFCCVAAFLFSPDGRIGLFFFFRTLLDEPERRVVPGRPTLLRLLLAPLTGRRLLVEILGLGRRIRRFLTFCAICTNSGCTEDLAVAMGA
ncbi:MAG: hypothetical protein ABJM29_17385 [Rhizobiaceae bacterium]